MLFKRVVLCDQALPRLFQHFEDCRWRYLPQDALGTPGLELDDSWRTNHRHVQGHRLQADPRHSLRLGRQDKAVRTGHERVNILSGNAAETRDPGHGVWIDLAFEPVSL